MNAAQQARLDQLATHVRVREQAAQEYEQRLRRGRFGLTAAAVLWLTSLLMLTAAMVALGAAVMAWLVGSSAAALFFWTFVAGSIGFPVPLKLADYMLAREKNKFARLRRRWAWLDSAAQR